MKQLNNCNANNNADNIHLTSKKSTKKDKGLNIPSNPSAVPWDSTPDTAAEMINTYGTYEIQPTADNQYMFPKLC